MRLHCRMRPQALYHSGMKGVRRLDARCFFRRFGSSSEDSRFPNHETLVQELVSLKGDPLESDGGRIVAYRGNPSAKLMIIGEAPGAEEDRQGKPFVGKSGQLLDNILHSVGFNEEDVYITNIVKRRPMRNRDPLQWEILYYKPWLQEQIRLVDPCVVMLVGRLASRSILKNYSSPDATKAISKMRGNWYEFDSRWFMPVYHPAYLLRNPQRTAGSPKAQTWRDIQEIRRKVDQLEGAGNSGESISL